VWSSQLSITRVLSQDSENFGDSSSRSPAATAPYRRRLPRPRTERNAIGAGCRLQGRERAIRIGFGQVAHEKEIRVPHLRARSSSSRGPRRSHRRCCWRGRAARCSSSTGPRRSHRRTGSYRRRCYQSYADRSGPGRQPIVWKELRTRTGTGSCPPLCVRASCARCDGRRADGAGPVEATTRRDPTRSRS